MGKITLPEVFDRLLTRLEKRIEALKGVKLPGYEMVIAELEVEHTYLLRAKRYLEKRCDCSTGEHQTGEPKAHRPGVPSQGLWQAVPGHGSSLVSKMQRSQATCGMGTGTRFCSWLAMAGASIKEIQEAAGHKSITMSARYSHLSPAHKESVVERLVGTVAS
jgi:site-specific recombinase XerD